MVPRTLVMSATVPVGLGIGRSSVIIPPIRYSQIGLLYLLAYPPLMVPL